MNPTSLLSGLGAAISAEPQLGGAGSSGESSPGTGDLFLALVAGLLSEQPTDAATAAEPTPVPEQMPGQFVAPVAPVVAGEPGTAPPAEVEQTDPQPEVVDPTQVAAVVVPVVLPPALLTEAVSAETQPTVAAVPTAPRGTPVVDPPSAPTIDATRAPAPEASAVQASHAADAVSPDAAQPEAPVATASAPATQPTAVTPSASSPTTPQATPVVGVAAPTPTVPTAPPALASTDVHRVAEQVFPEVVRVSSSAEGGPQRVTVKLNPEALGEVRVTLTQRGGELEVTLSAGHEARRALAEGTPELQRLLESVGRADSRVVIRDLPTSASPVQPIAQDGSSLRTDVSTDLGGDAWSGAGRPGGEPAPDREATRYATSGSTTATDGTSSATAPSRATTTDPAGRSGGLDVSI